ncbi:HNH endonuclease signature motif containing protein [uncultured Ruegeria sp.]|uniref:HNH endonuclease signature motif containing protein n=1 Tax=uncultured Ruegeria sp. TaxID=259304 RepID=UPI0034558811
MNEAPIHELKRCLRYDAAVGRIFWLGRDAQQFSCERLSNSWNARFKGKYADVSIRRDGYRRLGFKGQRLLAHRVAWALHTGRWPALYIDHINGDKADNRAVNLREVEHVENARNQKKRHDNSSGRTGVYWFPREGKWKAQITASGKRHCLGTFQDKESAVLAREQAERSLGFHSNHGRAEV